MQNMPMGPMQMNPGLQPGGLQSPMQQSPANLQQAQMQQAQMQAQQQQQEKLDNISKVKSLVGPLKESLSVSIYLIYLYVINKSLSGANTFIRYVLIVLKRLKISFITSYLIIINYFLDNP